MAEDAPIKPEALRDFVAKALGSQGVPDGDAAEVASLMVEADIFGYGTHGVFRLRQYMARLSDAVFTTQAIQNDPDLLFR
jgi:LDH2 family malate/lactate/ureidoglycolate dehydrogenase